MAKKDFSAAIGASLQAEETAAEDRFAKADAYFEDKASTPKEQKTPNPKHRKQAEVRPKAVRDIYTMPPDDHALIAVLKDTCMRAGVETSKSGILRAGLHALRQLSDAELIALVGSMEPTKRGRRPAEQ